VQSKLKESEQVQEKLISQNEQLTKLKEEHEAQHRELSQLLDTNVATLHSQEAQIKQLTALLKET